MKKTVTWKLRLYIMIVYPALSLGWLGATVCVAIVCQQPALSASLAVPTIFAFRELRWLVIWLSTEQEIKVIEPLMMKPFWGEYQKKNSTLKG